MQPLDVIISVGLARKKEFQRCVFVFTYNLFGHLYACTVCVHVCVCIIRLITYRKSGNFRVKNFSCDNFSC